MWAEFGELRVEQGCRRFVQRHAARFDLPPRRQSIDWRFSRFRTHYLLSSICASFSQSLRYSGNDLETAVVEKSLHRDRAREPLNLERSSYTHDERARFNVGRRASTCRNTVAPVTVLVTEPQTQFDERSAPLDVAENEPARNKRGEKTQHRRVREHTIHHPLAPAQTQRRRSALTLTHTTPSDARALRRYSEELLSCLCA